MKDSLIYKIDLYQDLSLHPPIAISRSHMKRYSYISFAKDRHIYDKNN